MGDDALRVNHFVGLLKNCVMPDGDVDLGKLTDADADGDSAGCASEGGCGSGAARRLPLITSKNHQKSTRNRGRLVIRVAGTELEQGGAGAAATNL